VQVGEVEDGFEFAERGAISCSSNSTAASSVAAASSSSQSPSNM
jgi:hypothetical protein